MAKKKAAESAPAAIVPSWPARPSTAAAVAVSVTLGAVTTRLPAGGTVAVVSATSGTAAVNNFYGAGGMACVQKSSGNVTPGVDPDFQTGITNIEILRMALTRVDMMASVWVNSLVFGS